jgi:hypothetical protein
MDFVRINFTPKRIKYILFNIIKKKVFDNNGIIFGGFVRDMIISDHYKSIYNSRNDYDIHKFWNKLYQPETAARALVAQDMDIDDKTFTRICDQFYQESELAMQEELLEQKQLFPLSKKTNSDKPN